MYFWLSSPPSMAVLLGILFICLVYLDVKHPCSLIIFTLLLIKNSSFAKQTFIKLTFNSKLKRC